MFETTFDRMLYPIGFKTTMTRNIRKWKHLPALTSGQAVTIKQIDWKDIGGGNLIPRLQIETEDGKRRWISADVEPCMETGRNQAAHKRLGEIAADFFDRRD